MLTLVLHPHHLTACRQLIERELLKAQAPKQSHTYLWKKKHEGRTFTLSFPFWFHKCLCVRVCVCVCQCLITDQSSHLRIQIWGPSSSWFWGGSGPTVGPDRPDSPQDPSCRAETEEAVSGTPHHRAQPVHRGQMFQFGHFWPSTKMHRLKADLSTFYRLFLNSFFVVLSLCLWSNNRIGLVSSIVVQSVGGHTWEHHFSTS